MAITTIDINDEYLAAAREALGTTSKVDTVNQALKSIADASRRRGLIDRLADADGVDLDAIDDAWR